MHFMRAACLFEGQTLRDQGLDLAFFRQVQQRQQVMAEPRRFEPHKPLDAVGHHALSPGLEPIA